MAETQGSGFMSRKAQRQAKSVAEVESVEVTPETEVVEEPKEVVAEVKVADLEDSSRAPVERPAPKAKTSRSRSRKPVEEPVGSRKSREGISTLGISTSEELWRFYKLLALRSGVEGRTVSMAEIVRLVLAEGLPDVRTSEGLDAIRDYADAWTQKRRGLAGDRTNRQVLLPRSMVADLRWAVTELAKRGEPVSVSAIVCGILDQRKPALEDVYRLMKG